MDSKTKARIAIFSVCIVLVVVLTATVHLWLPACVDPNAVYDEKLSACRVKCVAPNMKYDLEEKTCVCPGDVPTYIPNSNTCVQQCGTNEHYDAAAQSCVPDPPPPCSPPPGVNSQTGAVTNDTHFATADGSCGAGTITQLSELCIAATNAKGQRYDGYDPQTGSCYILPACSTADCDASYCTSASVKDTLGAIKQVDAPGSGYTCENPSESDVAALCSDQPGLLWQPPFDCFRAVTSPTIKLVYDSKTPPSTTSISGTLTQALLNAADAPIIYKYQLVSGSEIVAEGGMNSSKQVAGSGTFSCNFTIRLPPGIDNGLFTLVVVGAPVWDMTRQLYTLQSGNQGESIYLLPAADAPGTVAALNPKLNVELAKQLATNQNWVQTTLKSLNSTNPGLIRSDTTTVTALAYSADAQNQQALLVGCTNSYCQPFVQQVKQKMVILAWPKVVATASTCGSLSAQTFVKYMLLRASGSEVKELLGPTRQPFDNDVLSYVDVLPINISVQYILAAYVVRDQYDLTSFADAACKSQQVYVSLNVGDYTDAFCHTINPGTGRLPQWMWRSADGMCEWIPNYMPAQDYGCMFETGTFDTNNLKLADANSNQCVPLEKVKPTLVTNWESQYCNLDKFDASTACIGGVKTLNPATVRCKQTAAVGSTELSLYDFETRLNAALNFGSQHGMSSSQMASLEGAAKQQSLWDSVYNRCGARTEPGKWGRSTATCAPDDGACLNLAQMAGCDRNVCSDWKETGTTTAYATFQQTKTCYPSSYVDSVQLGGKASPCCSNAGTYSFNTLVSSNRGSCSCTGNAGGAICNQDACANVTCDGKGACRIDPNTGEPYCLCNAGYYNVVPARKMDKELDCGRKYKGVPVGKNGCELYKLVNGVKVRDPDCTIDPYACTCPRVCGPGETPGPNKMCVAVDKNTCRQNCFTNNNTTCSDTGCIDNCDNKMPTASNLYKYYHFDASDPTPIICSTCKGHKAKCDSDAYPSDCCLEGVCKNDCVQQTAFGCSEYEHRCFNF